MSYTYQRLNNMLGGQDDQSKVNIFGQPSEGPSAQNQLQQSQPKTSTEGELEGGGQSNVTSSGGQAQGQSPNRSVSAIAKTQGAKSQFPKAFGMAQNSLSQAKQNLQNEADQYTQKYQQQNYGLGNEVLQNAQKGDQAAMSQVATRLGQASAPQVEAFKPQTQTSFNDINSLGTDEGIKNILRQQAGGKYTGGESALDLAIMKRNPNFNLIREQLIQGQKDVQSQAAALQEQKTKEAQDLAAKRYGEETEAIRKNLGGQVDEIRSQQAQRAAQATAANQAAEAQRRAYIQQQAQQAYDELAAQSPLDLGLVTSTGLGRNLGDFISRDAWANPYIDQEKGINEDPRAAQFYSGVGSVTPEQLATEEEANRFNNIMSMLGRTDRMQTGSGAGHQSFNKSAFQESLKKEAQKTNKNQQDQANAVIGKVIDPNTGQPRRDIVVTDRPTKEQYRSGNWISKQDVQKAYKTIGGQLPDQFK